MNIRYLGIDHGKHSGLSIIDVTNGKINLVERWSYDIRGSDDGNKFYEFYNYVDKVVLEYKPNVLCIEKPMSMLNGNTTRTLIGLYSMLKMIATMREVRISEVFPTSMKKLICGSGRAEKSELASSLANRLKCDVSDIVEYEMYSSKAKQGQIKNTMYDISDSIGLIMYTIMSGGIKNE